MSNSNQQGRQLTLSPQSNDEDFVSINSSENEAVLEEQQHYHQRNPVQLANKAGQLITQPDSPEHTQELDGEQIQNSPIEKTQSRLVRIGSKLSKVSTIKLDRSKIIPKSNRRGLLGRFTIIPEYDNPRELPSNIRFLLVFVVAFCAMLGPMGTSILLPATDDIVDNLDTDVATVNISIGIYLLTLGIIPIWWSNFSERHGRRSIYIISFSMYLCFTIGCSLSKSIGMLIGFRVLSGGCAASVQSVGAGTISDLYPITERGAAMGIFYLGPLAGPLLAPIIGGAITQNQSFGWRATQWFLVILSGCSIIMIIFLLPETLRRQDTKEAIRQVLRDRLKKNVSNDIESQTSSSTASPNGELNGDKHKVQQAREDNQIIRIMTHLSSQRSISDQDDEEEVPVDMLAPIGRITSKKSIKQKENDLRRLTSQVETAEKAMNSTPLQKFKYYTYIYMLQPLKSLVFFKYPPVFISIAYSAPCFAALYVVNMTLSYCYSNAPYNFNALLVGLVYIPNSVAYFITSILGGRFNDYLLKKKAEKYGVLAPESRFGINVYVAAIVMPGGLLITGWCLDKKEHWVTPLIGTALFGFAQMIIIGVTVTYLADSLPGRGATGIALNNFVRQIMASGCSFATEPLIRAMGVGPLLSMCAGIVTVLALLLVVLKKNGDRWRETFDLEKLYDIVDS